MGSAFGRRCVEALGACFRVAAFVAFGLCFVVPFAMGQQKVKSGEKQDSLSTGNLPVFHATTRIVVVDVVAVDSQGNPVTDLRQDEFQVYEHLDWFRRVWQKVASFRAVTEETVNQENVPASSAVSDRGTSAGMFSVPPTILLVDTLNIRGDGGLNILRRMDEIVNAIPSGVPVAVCSMGNRLRVLQNFTTDHASLKSAAANAFTQPFDPSDYVRVAVAQVEKELPGADHFRTERFSASTFHSVFTQIAKDMAGVPGRKNLIWLTDGVPSAIPGQGSFWSDSIEPAIEALSNARVAVYPIAASGIVPTGLRMGPGQTQVVSDPANGVISPDLMSYLNQTTMLVTANQTGGRTCVKPEDLTGCLKKAITHGLTYYELSYYPVAKSWLNGEHGIIIKTTRPGIKLMYRRSYLVEDKAKPHHNPDKPLPEKTRRDKELQRAACGDSLAPDAIRFSVEAMKSGRPGWVKYALLLNPERLAFNPVQEDKHRVRVDYAICTFDKAGLPLKYMQHNTEQVLTDEQLKWVMEHGLPHDDEFLPSDNLARLTLVVRDDVSGLLGSVDVEYSPKKFSEVGVSQ